MRRLKGFVCVSGLTFVLLAGCASFDLVSVLSLPSQTTGRDRVVAGSLEVVAQSAQTTLGQMGLVATTNRKGEAIYIDSKTPAGANSLSLIFQLILPFTSSAFVRPDSMSAGVRWFSEYQPFTPVIDTLRGLLLGTPIDNSAVLAVAWCVVLALVGYLWARAVYNRNSIR